MKNYKLEKIKEELARSLARDQELLRLWEAVEYKTKKGRAAVQTDFKKL